MGVRITSGVAGLDTVLHGGFPRNSITVLMGRPGTGKTIFATALLFANISAEQRGLYIGTVSEPLTKTLRYMQDFDFFRVEAVQDQVMYEDVSPTIRQESFAASMDRIIELIRENEPAFLVIDSMRALQAVAPSGEEYRKALYRLASVISSMPITAFWVGEYSEEDIDHSPEFAVADGIVQLVLQRVGVNDIRYVRVLKMRGTDFQGGDHAYRISPSGLAVYPRLVPIEEPADFTVMDDRAQTGVEVLDAMVSEGFWKGGSTVVFGPPGSGKTLLGLHFLFRGIEQGEKGLLLTMQENVAQLSRVSRGFGWDLPGAIAAGTLDLMYVSPVDVYMDQIIIEVMERAKRLGATRIVIDSLNDLQAAASNIERFHDYMYTLLQHLSRRGMSLYMTAEVSDLFATTYLSEFGVSHMSDNLVLLHYLREESEVKRAIAVLKTRGSAHDPRIREFTITSAGFRIGEPFNSSSIFRS